MDAVIFAALVATCAPGVDLTTARALVATESSFNVYAIGVVNGSLARQPRTRQESIEVARRLQASGYDYSVGLGQINRRNFASLGLTLERALDPCLNLAAMQSILESCYERARRMDDIAQRALRRALSCYYSGNFITGVEYGYVSRVARAVSAHAVRHPHSPAP